MWPQGQEPGTAISPEPWLRGLDFLWLELTSRCNLRCSHCYADAGPSLPQGMSHENWSRVLREAFDLGCRRVQFTGGEPSLYPDLPRLLGDARRIGFDSVEVYTNGIRLSQRLRNALIKENVNLAFSVYGSQSQVHDAITGRQGSFEKTLKSIRWALKVGLKVRTSIIEMPSNADDIKATQGLLRRFGVRSTYVDCVRAVGRGDGRVSTNGKDPWGELCGQCWRQKLAIDPAGNVFPCVFARFCNVGHVSQSLASILNSEQLYSFRKEVWKMNKRTKKSRSLRCAPHQQPPCAPDMKKMPCAPDIKNLPCAPDVKKLPCAPDIKKLPCAPDIKKLRCAPDIEKPCAPDVEKKK